MECAGVVIRSGTVRDVAAIEQLECRCFPDPWSGDLLVAGMAGPHHRCLVAVTTGGVLVAYCFIQQLPGEVEIQSLAVSPAYRRRGIARALVGAVFAAARGAGANKALLEVRGGNHAAVALYRDAGFTKDGLRRGYYADGEDALLMSCDL